MSYLHWGGILACVLVAYSLLGLEEIGVEVEHPFGRDFCDLPLDQLVAGLTGELLEALRRYEGQGGDGALGGSPRGTSPAGGWRGGGRSPAKAA